MKDYAGLYKTNPRLSLLLLLALFSLAGIPPVAGFFGKFFLFTAAASQGFYWLVLIGALNATLALYYYLLPVKAMFITPNDEPIASFQSLPMMRIGLVVCAIGIVVIGFFGPVYEYIYTISAIL